MDHRVASPVKAFVVAVKGRGTALDYQPVAARSFHPWNGKELHFSPTYAAVLRGFDAAWIKRVEAP